MRLDIITIFPRYLAPLGESLIGKAIDDGLLSPAVHDLRDWATDRHRTVDDTPYGGGPGMVMRPDIWGRALDDVTAAPPTVDHDRMPGSVTPTAVGSTDPVLVIPTPAGEPFTQDVAQQLAEQQHLIIACGRYEGIDGRVVDDAASRMPVRQLSIGDYVLAGGEAAALVMIEAIARLVPGVLGNSESAVDDSFSGPGPLLLEGPVYTRPETYRDLTVPPVLLSGDHGRVARFRRDEALRRTARFRPDLLRALSVDECDERDYEVLTELGAPLPEGLAEAVAQTREARERRRARRTRARRRQRGASYPE